MGMKQNEIRTADFVHIWSKSVAYCRKWYFRAVRPG